MPPRPSPTRRILLGAFAMEANTFARGVTTLVDFADQVWAVGDAITPTTLGPQSELCAAWRELERVGIEVVPSLAAWSAPRRPLDREALDAIVGHVVEACDDAIDGAYLMLHGSAVARDEDDPEGVLLAALRERLGPDRPIAISLDCHANLTSRMVDAADAITAYRTCPHVDTARTGAAAARLLIRALDGAIRPVTALAVRPMITPPQMHDNEREPFRTLMRRCDELERRPGVLAAGLLLVQPWIDVEGLSCKAVITTDGDLGLARDTAEELIDGAWEVREAFLEGTAPAVDDALAEALAGQAPYVFADSGDSTNGGTVGDSTELLRALARSGTTARVLLSVTEPEAAAIAYRAGAGATVELTLGSGATGDYNEPVSLRVEVLTTFDGSFAYTHPVNAGYRASTGPAALVRSGGTDIVVHARSVGLIDPSLYRALGADPSTYQVLQAKSHVSYRAGFDPVTPRSVVAATAGPSTADLTRLHYLKRPRPLFPFEPNE
jgi:microcystin degradation protein MlrC